MRAKLYLIIAALIIIYLSRSYWMPTKIARVFQGEGYITISDLHYKSTAVLVDNPPITRMGKIELFKNYENKIKGDYPIKSEWDEVKFIKNKPERPYDSQELKYWQGDNQFCFKGQMNGLCISRDEILFIIMARDMGRGSEYIGDYNGMPLYIWYIDR